MPLWISVWILSHCPRLTTGPMVVPSARGSPALVFSATLLAMAATSFIFDNGTIIRDGALHDCPELLNMCITPPLTALARSPPSGPRPLIRLNTPLGTPASCRISAKINADVGVDSDGFRIMVQPAASAGATLQVIWFSGQFHGVIMPTPPTGSRTTTAEGSCSSK